MSIDYEALASKLEHRGFIPHIVENADALRDALMELLEDGSVGFGGSSGVESLKLYERLKENGREVWWHWKDEDKKTARKMAMFCDWYVCSANALTEDGQIVEIDGTGNRVAALICGPERIAVVAGSNKLAKNVEEGIRQIKARVSPANARRLGLKTPCALTDRCGNCLKGDSMCRVTAVFDQPTRNASEFHVFLLKEPLGL